MAEGGIIVCLHLGNWEASVLPLAAAGARHVAVYRRMRNVLLEDHMLSLRAAYYKGGLLAKGDAAARGLLRQARAGGSLGVMADLRDSSDYMVTFFGRPAPSTPLPAMLARQFGRPIFAVGLVRTGPARFRMVAAEITVPRTDDRAVDIQAATQAIQAMFESWVRLWPGQWMWAHRRYN
jgi:KDO2-lipid IV(A) lauroyltransferase